MSTDRTRTLVDAAGNGDGDALEELVQKYLPRLQAFVRLRMGPSLRARESSMDVVQSVCREVLQDIDRFEYRGEGSFLSWLFTAALNKMRTRLRYYHRQRRDVDREVHLTSGATKVYADMLSPSEIVVEAEQIDRIEHAFDRLPEDYREVISLTKVVGLKSSEVAEHLGRSMPAARKLLGRALARFSDELNRE